MNGKDFFKLLVQNDDFCAQLGKATLAAGRLESLMIIRFGNDPKLAKATLGQLIKVAEKCSDFQTLVPHLETLKTQRNYLTHNIYALLSDRIDETILERNDLVELDVLTYRNRAIELTENLNGFANIVENMQ